LAAAVRSGSCASRGIVVVSLCRPPCTAQGLRARSRRSMQSFAASSMGLRITARSRRHPTAERLGLGAGTSSILRSQAKPLRRGLRLTSNVRFQICFSACRALKQPMNLMRSTSRSNSSHQETAKPIRPQLPAPKHLRLRVFSSKYRAFKERDRQRRHRPNAAARTRRFNLLVCHAQLLFKSRLSLRARV
jgi:hypothetical protein